MKICVAQAKSSKGDIERNIVNHKRLIDLAVSKKAEIIIFPELSLTGYEPTLAREMAMDPDDNRLQGFRQTSNARGIVIGVGAPVKNGKDVSIGMLIFQPDQPVQLYSKKYLHPDEEPFFVEGKSTVGLIGKEKNISLAICYEIAIPEHPENAFKAGARIYIASVAKSAEGVEKAIKGLSAIAAKYSMTVLMSNCTGYCDNFESGGKTSAWNDRGMLMGQLDDNSEGILIMDTEGAEPFIEIV